MTRESTPPPLFRSSGRAALKRTARVLGNLRSHVPSLIVFLVGGKGETIFEICAKHLHATPPRPSVQNPGGVPALLERIILRCLEKQPADRYPSAAALMSALDELSRSEPWTQDDARTWWQTRGNAITSLVHTAQRAKMGEDETATP